VEGGEARALLRKLLREHAVLRGDFVLSSGQRSNYYFDARRVTLSAAGAGLVGRVLFEALQDLEVDAVAGLAVGADPIVASVAVVAGLAGCSLDGIIVRKDAKAHGVGGRIVGPWRAGLRVAVVDDTLTTGSSLLTAARAIEEAGGRVRGAYVLVDREEGGREAVEAAGYSCHAVFSRSEVLGDEMH